MISRLIKNPKLLKRIQRDNFSNVIHKIEKKVQKLDDLKNYLLTPKINFINKKKHKILHISQFDERNDLDFLIYQ